MSVLANRSIHTHIKKIILSFIFNCMSTAESSFNYSWQLHRCLQCSLLIKTHSLQSDTWQISHLTVVNITSLMCLDYPLVHPHPLQKSKLKPAFLLSSHPPTTITTHSSVRKISHCFFCNPRQKLLLPTKAVYKQSQMKEGIFISQRPHLFVFLTYPIKWYDSLMTSSTNIHSCAKFCQNITKLADSSYCCKFNDVPMMTVAGKKNVPAL